MPAMPLLSSMFASASPSTNGWSATLSGASANIAGQNMNTAQDASSSFSSILKQKTDISKAPDAPPPPKQANKSDAASSKPASSSSDKTPSSQSSQSSQSPQSAQPSQTSQSSGQTGGEARHDESGTASESTLAQQGTQTSIMATLLGFNAGIAKGTSGASRDGANLSSETTSLTTDANEQAALAALLAQQQTMTPYDRKLADDGTNPGAGAGQRLLSDAMLAGTDDRALADFAALAEKALLHSGLRSSEGSGKDSPALSFDQAFTAAHTQIALSEQGGARLSGNAVSSLSSYNVNTPVGARGWDYEVGNKLVWMAGKQEQNAELVLHPPQLGRVEVSIQMKGDQVSTTFVAAHPVARDALENALPRLREMFADAGLSLGQAHVGSDSNYQQASTQHENNTRSSRFSHEISALEEGNMPIPRTMSAWQHQGRGLVDTFA